MSRNFLKKNSRIAFFLAVVVAAAPNPVAAAAELAAVRFGVSSPVETRLVIDSNELPDFYFQAGGPGTFSIVLPEAARGANFEPAGRGAGHIAAFRASRDADQREVITFTLKRGAKIKDAFVIPPSAANAKHRIVVDLVNADMAALAASLPARKFAAMEDVIAAVAPRQAAPASKETNDVAPAAVRSASPVIVIDAGHGGSDPGAAGPGGVRESDATLAAALALADALRESGRYEVVLTRSKDDRLAHEERSRIAREAKADLFISLHADAHPSAKVRGGSVYTLSDEGTERSAKEALEKGDYHIFDVNIGEADPQVGGILYNLAQRRTGDESDRFAEILIARLAGVTPLLNNSHRRGNFRVLLAPDVPAVLLELAFISNRADESNLTSAGWRKSTMTAAASAIDEYFRQRASKRHASNAESAATR